MKTTKAILSMTVQERKNVKYDLVGDKIKVKLANLDVLVEMIREQRKKAKLANIVNLVPSRIRKFHDPSFSMSFVKDSMTGVVYGIAVGFHSDGNIKWQKIQIGESMTLDIDQDNDAKMWAVLRMHPCCDVSPFADEARYIVVDPEMEANIELAKGLLIETVLKLASSMDREEVKHFARWCDIPLDGSETVNMIRSKLVRYAIDHPEQFEEKYQSNSKEIGQVFKSAKQLGLISHDTTKGYKYHDTNLGLTEFECIDTLEKHLDITSSMKREVDNIDQQTESKVPGYTEEKKSTRPTPPPVPEPEPEEELEVTQIEPEKKK